MACLIGCLPGGSLFQEAFQLVQVVHAETMKIAPTRYAEQVVDDHGGVAFTSKAFVSAELFGSGVSLISVFVRIEQFHRFHLVVVQLGSGFCLISRKKNIQDSVYEEPCI